MITEDEIGKIIKRVATNYARKCWWADRRDLEQEAWLEVLATMGDREFMREWSPAHCRNYIYRAAACRMMRFLWAESSPVVGGDRTRGGDRKVAGLVRAPLDAAPDCSGEGSDPEHMLQQAQALDRIRELRFELSLRISELARGAVAADAVLCVLLDGVPPAEAAKTAGVPVQRLWSDTSWVKKSACSDVVVRVLLESLRQTRSESEWA